ncbi:hypothetical protein QTP86_021782, partial [Hemibagrus guttatus]
MAGCVCVSYLGNTWHQDALWEEGGPAEAVSCFGVDSASKFLRSQSNPASVGCAGQTSLIHGGPTSQLAGLKGSAANILVPDPTALLQESSGVHAS